jgi:hypothetical protein
VKEEALVREGKHKKRNMYDLFQFIT